MAGIHLAVGKLPCAGDETRYAFQGVGLYTNGSFYPDRAVWKRFADSSGCGNGGVLQSDHRGRPLQTISASVIYGAALRVAGLEGARWLNFAVGCVGLTLLYVLLWSLFPRRTGGPSAAAIVSFAAIALSLPFVPYLQLIYPEVLLFTAVAAALYGLTRRRYYLTLVAIVLLPFLHVRALPLSLIFFLVLLVQMRRDKTAIAIRWQFLALYAAGMAIFAASQYRLFGSLTGSAFPSYAPSLSIALERIGMQLYGVRHGAVAYAPLLLVGFAGLLLGTLRRERVCEYSLILFGTYFATFMWSNASESWTARFWVAGLPFLAVGLGFWLNQAKRWWEWLPAAPLAAIDIGNTLTYIFNPLWYLESRQASIPYAALFLIAHVHFGLLLPVDGEPGGIAPYAAPIAPLLAYTALLIALLVMCRVPSVTRSRILFTAAACALLTLPVAFAAANSVDATDYSVTVDPKQHEFVVRLNAPRQNVDAIQFDDQIPAFWQAPPYPRSFTIRCIRDGRVVSETDEPAHPLLILPRCVDPTSIEIEGNAGSQDATYRGFGRMRLIRRLL
ncbi:MAG TPA: hypothetical protein VMF11_15235 [Candidatus Baltobacteraceae bacterium]|nr:hypothetical protein [Candidatus Baltobacteraceae bacterium]